MSHMLLHVTEKETSTSILQRLVRDEFDIELCEGKEMDGVFVPFYILHKKQD